MAEKPSGLMHTEPRGTSQLNLVVVHTNEGPEVSQGAQGLARYLQTIQGGYHKIADNTEVVTTAADNVLVWGAGGPIPNPNGLHICCVGYANQTDAQWHDTYSQAELKNAAAAVAVWCVEYHIPVRRLSPQQLAQGQSGIVGHVDCTDAFGGTNAGHTDPGPNFPWTEFLALVASHLTPPVTKPKVPPSFSPPLDDVVDSCAYPPGGTLVLQTNGNVWHVTDGNVSGPFRPYGGPAVAARVKPKNYGNVLVKKWGYQVFLEDGSHVYDVKPA